MNGELQLTLDSDRLRAAYDAHYTAILRLCVLVTGRRELAEDLTQEAFMRAAPKLGSLDESVIRAYLRTAALNVWKNHARRTLLEARSLTRAHPVWVDEEQGTDALWELVRALPRGQRSCLVLRYYEQLTERETADLLGCSVGNVKSQTSRALTKLRRSLLDDD